MTEQENSIGSTSSAYTNRVFLLEVDQSLRISYVSPAIKSICGFTPKEVLGIRITKLFPLTEFHNTLLRTLESTSLNTSAEVRVETECRHRAGSAFEVEVLVRAVQYSSGATIHAYVRDLSSHKNVETQLRLSDQILNTVNSLVLVANGNGQIIYTSPSVKKILGYSSTEVLGYGWWIHTIANRETRRSSTERIARCARGEIPPRSGTWEEKLADKDGNAHWFLWQDAKGPDDLFIGVAQEITEWKAMGQALDLSSKQVRAIFSSALEGLLIFDDDLLYIDANPAACALVGRPREQIIGKRAGSFSAEPELAYQRFKATLGNTVSLDEGEIRAPDGTIRNMEYTLRKDILPGQHLLVTRDVTRRKRLEYQLLQSQKMQAVGQLAGGVAHDFNNMLTVIRGYCELLQKSVPAGSTQRRYVDTVLSAADKASMTTQQLLAFSRQQVIQPREVNMNVALDEMGKLLHRLIGEDVRVRFTLSDCLGFVRIDPGQLNQVLLNLVVNARDAMPNGGVLTIETANATIDEKYAGSHLKVAPGEYVMLTVTDSGCGMSAETVSRIFEPFFTTKPAGKGTGLGLSTVYGIVEQAHGAIYVYSEPGEGTSFKLYFPRIDEAKSDLVFGRPHSASGIGILVIEDDRETCRMISDSLRAEGYEVESAGGGSEALRLCRQMSATFALVISDVTMPGADGQDIQGYLAIHHPNTRTIYISGYSRTTLRERGILSPDAIYLQKPFRMEELLLRVEEVLSLDGSISRLGKVSIDTLQID